MAMRKYGLWQPEDMQIALAEFKEGKTGLNECFRWRGITKRWFKRRFKRSVQRGVCNHSKKSINGRDTDLHEEIKEELVQHILKFEENMFGLSITDARKLAFEMAIRNQLKIKIKNGWEEMVLFIHEETLHSSTRMHFSDISKRFQKRKCFWFV
jgi:hypothetical protein